MSAYQKGKASCCHRADMFNVSCHMGRCCNLVLLFAILAGMSPLKQSQFQAFLTKTGGSPVKKSSHRGKSLTVAVSFLL